VQVTLVPPQISALWDQLEALQLTKSLQSTANTKTKTLINLAVNKIMIGTVNAMKV